MAATTSVLQHHFTSHHKPHPALSIPSGRCILLCVSLVASRRRAPYMIIRCIWIRYAFNALTLGVCVCWIRYGKLVAIHLFQLNQDSTITYTLRKMYYTTPV